MAAEIDECQYWYGISEGINRLFAVSNGLDMGRLAMHDVDRCDEVAGGPVASGPSLGGLDQGREAFKDSV